MTETHVPTGDPQNPAVRYEASDAQARGVLFFGLALAAGCAIVAALLWWMYVAFIYHENAVKGSNSPWGAADRAGSTQEPNAPARAIEPGTERSGIDANPRLEGLNVSSPEYGSRLLSGTAQEQAAEQEKYLAEAGWVDRDKGVVHIPIDQAMKKLAGKLPARADGVAEDEFLQAPSRSSSGRLPRGDKP